MTTRSSVAASANFWKRRASSSSVSREVPPRPVVGSRQSDLSVAILDSRLPDGTGIDVCRDVRSLDPRICAVILTSYDDDDALFSAILGGAVVVLPPRDVRRRPGRPANPAWS